MLSVAASPWALQLLGVNMQHFGKFKITVTDANTGEVKVDLPEQDNMILDSMFGKGQYANTLRRLYCYFGSGSSPVSKSDTSLEAVVGSYMKVDTGADYMRDVKVTHKREGNIFTHEKLLTMAGGQGDVQGNISELGLASTRTSKGTGIFTRALIKDVNGDPTTISLGPNDILTVIYRIGYQIDLTNPLIESKVIDIGGTPTTCSLYWVFYDKPMQYSLWNIGSSNTHSDMASRGAHPLTPMYGLGYSFLFTGTITNYGDPTEEMTGLPGGSLGIPADNGSADGVSLKSNYQSKSIGPGVATGTWNGILFSPGNTGVGYSSTYGTCALVFDPPLIKGPSDVFDISNLALLSSRGA